MYFCQTKSKINDDNEVLGGLALIIVMSIFINCPTWLGDYYEPILSLLLKFIVKEYGITLYQS